LRPFYGFNGAGAPGSLNGRAGLPPEWRMRAGPEPNRMSLSRESRDE